MGGSLIAKQMEKHFGCRCFSFLKVFSKIVIKKPQTQLWGKASREDFL